MQGIIDKAAAYVREAMAHDCTGHDYLHVERVRTMALALRQAENDSADAGLIELVALVHDIGDAKLGNTAPLQSLAELVRCWGGDAELGRRVETAVAEIGFKGGFNKRPSSREAEIVQDADRLDAIGAVGIARAFAYGGHIGQKPFASVVSPRLFADEGEYRQRTGTTVNHFHEKLFRIADLLHTATARRLAESRVAFMRRFLQQLGEECGSDFMNGV